MDAHPLLQALILGIVEGLTEFLPISSTGHLILAGDLTDFNDERGKLFEIVIQSGAILAVVWEYRQRFATVLQGLPGDPAARRFGTNPAIAFILGAFVILWAERRMHTVTIHTVDDIGPRDALKLGFAQAVALIPGTSRSGSTIIGGLFFGLSRKAATEFSFFLAVPTLGAASLYQLWKGRHLLAWDDLGMWVAGFISAFISAFLCVRWLLRYISTHDFTIFAWYRIAFGIVVLLTWQFGLVDWTNP